MNEINVNTAVTEEEIKNWNWDDSVKKVKSLYNPMWRKASKELLEELYQAKKQLNKGAGNPHGKRQTWSGFVESVWPDGSPCQKTVDNWLRKYEIGDEQWKAEQDAKKKTKGALTPIPLNLDPVILKKKIENQDGTITGFFSVAELPNIICKATFTIS